MPVVDALTRLENEGLVEKRNRVGTFVSPVNQATFREWFETRGMIEDWAAPRIIERASVADLGVLSQLLLEARSVLQKSNTSSFDFCNFNDHYDSGFHIGLIKLAGNSYVTDSYTALHSRTRIGRSFVNAPVKREGDAQDFHEMILKAFKVRNVIRATHVADVSISLTLVNLNLLEARRVLIQAGSLGQHRFTDVRYTGRAANSAYPLADARYEYGAGEVAPPDPLPTEYIVSVNDTHLCVALPPGTEIRLRLGLSRHVGQASYTLP